METDRQSEYADQPLAVRQSGGQLAATNLSKVVLAQLTDDRTEPFGYGFARDLFVQRAGDGGQAPTLGGIPAVFGTGEFAARFQHL
jgi:hypothetical protein